MSIRIAELVGQIRLDNAYSPELKKVYSDLEAFGKKTKDIGGKITNIGSTISVGITAPLAAAAAAAMKFSNDFNTGLANVQSLIPDNVDRVNDLKTSVSNLSADVGKFTSDLTPALYQVISAFGDTADTVKVLEINAKAATAGVATTEQAIDLASAVTKGYGDTTQAAVQKVADLALTTVRLGKTTFPELANSMGRVISISNTMGQTQEELFAVFSTATGVTGSASEVATQYRGVLAALLNPTEDLTDLISSMGYETGEAMLQGLGLTNTLKTITEASEQSGKPITKFISQIEAVPLALSLAGSLSSSYEDKLASLRNSVGATNKAFEAQTQGINKHGFEIQQSIIRIQNSFQKLGDSIVPLVSNVLTPISKIIENVANAFSNLPPPLKLVSISILGIVAAAGPLLIIVGQLITAWGSLTLALSTPAIAGALATLVTIITGPVGIIAAVTALMLSWEPTRSILADLGTRVFNLVSNAIKITASIVVSLWKKSEGLRVVLFEIGKIIGRDLIGRFKSLVDILKSAYDWVVDLTEGIKILIEDSETVVYVIDKVTQALQFQLQKIKIAVDYWTRFVNNLEIVKKAKFSANFNKSVEASREAVEAANEQLENWHKLLDGIKNPPATKELENTSKKFDDVANSIKTAKESIEDLIGIKKLKDQIDLIKEFGLSLEDTEIVINALGSIDIELSNDLKPWILDQVEVLKKLRGELEELTKSIDNRLITAYNIAGPRPIKDEDRPTGGTYRPSLPFLSSAKEFEDTGNIVTRTIDKLNDNFKSLEPNVDNVASTIVNFASEMGIFSSEQQQNMQNLALAGKAVGEAFGGDNAATWAAAAGTLAGMMDLGRTGNAMAQGAAQGAQVGGGWGAIIGFFVGWIADAMHETEQSFANGATEAGRISGNVQEGAGQLLVKTKEIVNTVTSVINDILDAINGTLESFETWGIMLRKDSKGIRAWVNGQQKIFGEDLQGALDWIVTQIFKQAQISGTSPTIKAALKQFQGSTVEELQEILSRALSIDAMGLTDFGNELYAKIKEINSLLKTSISEIGEGTNNVLNGPTGLVSTFQDAYNNLFGLPEDVAATTRANIKILEAKVKLEYANLVALKARLEAEAINVKAGIESNKAILASADIHLLGAQGFQLAGKAVGDTMVGLTKTFGAAAYTFSVSAQTTVQALLAIDEAISALESFDFSEAAINAAIRRAQAAANSVGRIGSGGGSDNREQVKEDFWSNLERLEQLSQGIGEGLLDLVDAVSDIDRGIQEARDAKVAEEDLARSRQLQIEQLANNILEPYNAIANQPSPFESLVNGYQETIDKLSILGQEIPENLSKAFGIEFIDTFKSQVNDLASRGDSDGIKELYESLSDIAIPEELLAGLNEYLPEALTIAEEAIKETSESIIDSLGLPLEQTRDKLAQDAENIRKALQGATELGPINLTSDNGPVAVFQGVVKDLTKGFAPTLDKISSVSKEASQNLDEFTASIENNSIKSELVDKVSSDLLSQISSVLSYFGDTQLSAEVETSLRELSYHMEVARLHLMIETYDELGLISDRVLDLANQTFDLIDNADPSFEIDVSVTSSGGGYDPAAHLDDVDSLIERIRDGINSWLDLDVGEFTQAARGLKEELHDLESVYDKLMQLENSPRTRALAQQIQDAYNIAIAAFVDNTLKPFENLDLTDVESQFNTLIDQFDDIAKAFQEIGVYAENAERLAEAQITALQDLWDQNTQGVKSLIDRLTGVESGRASLDLLGEQTVDVEALFNRVMSGDLSALQDFESGAEGLLELINSTWGSSAEGGILRDRLLAMLQQVDDFDVTTLLDDIDNVPVTGEGLIGEPYEIKATDIISRPITVNELFDSLNSSNVNNEMIKQNLEKDNRLIRFLEDKEKRDWERRQNIFRAESKQRFEILHSNKELSNDGKRKGL